MRQDATLERLRPDLAGQWHPQRNGDLTPAAVTLASSRRVWWRCGQGHEWAAVVYSRTRTPGSGCPYCAGQLPTPQRNLATVHPDVAAQWHPTANALSPEEVTPRSKRRVWWRCGQGHEWAAIVSNRTTGSGCPYCAGQLPTRQRNLATVHPDVAAQWHPTANGDLSPEDVTPASDRKVWWRCERGHAWPTKVSSRTSRGTGCPYCAGKLPTPERNLATLHPEVAAQWHPTANALSPHEVTPGSEVAPWWSCPAGHEWTAEIRERVRGRVCPFCSGRRPSPTGTRLEPSSAPRPVELLTGRRAGAVREDAAAAGIPLFPAGVTADDLRYAYLEQRWSLRRICAELGIPGRNSLFRLLDAAGIPRRGERANPWDTRRGSSEEP